MVDVSRAIKAVRFDVASALDTQLSEGEGWKVDEEFTAWEDDPPRNGDSSAVVIAWTWNGTNDGLFGLARTGRHVTVRGLTVVTDAPPDDPPVDVDPDDDSDFRDLRCHRYVDWLPALAQAGITLFTRPIVELDPRFRQPREPGSADDLEVTAVLEENPELAEALEELEVLINPTPPDPGPP
jgi:hypothetical protein